MNIRHRLAAIAATAGLAATGLALAAPAANAATPAPQAASSVCKITGFTPSTITVGLKTTKIKFAPKTTGCKPTSWSISGDNFAVSNKDPYATFTAKQLTGKTEDVVVQASTKTRTTEVTYIDGLHFKAPTQFNTRTQASPEPAKKGHKINVQGQLAVVSYKQDAWTGYAGQNLKLQFKTKGGHYKTVKTVKSGQYGFAQTTVTAKKSGTYRFIFAGNSTATSAKASGDYVKVTK